MKVRPGYIYMKLRMTLRCCCRAMAVSSENAQSLFSFFTITQTLFASPTHLLSCNVQSYNFAIEIFSKTEKTEKKIRRPEEYLWVLYGSGHVLVVWMWSM